MSETKRFTLIEGYTHDPEFSVMVEATDGWRLAEIRQDGCIHYYRVFNTPLHYGGERFQTVKRALEDDNTDYLHICDIDEEIAYLQALKKAALAQFGGAGAHWEAPPIVDADVIARPAALLAAPSNDGRPTQRDDQ